ncbi:hypothetical protein Tsubulata_029556 [Turnera subulata]|uniref:Endonuclease/exonuclease/phosphatase domain-containing protein n=1 Tax=Turnera subulata TaxID=218843 RepID=A0A9Q0IZL0_9ROSI|nr:hypothetical protein Tsubulata_029556 [Turnera subulata]
MELEALRSSYTSPWMVLGDFNETLVVADRRSGRLCVRGSGALRRFMHALQLHKFPLEGRLYTWANSLAASRIDRVMATLEWCLAFPNLFLETERCGFSDHWTLILAQERRELTLSEREELAVSRSLLLQKERQKEKASPCWTVIVRSGVPRAVIFQIVYSCVLGMAAQHDMVCFIIFLPQLCLVLCRGYMWLPRTSSVSYGGH